MGTGKAFLNYGTGLDRVVDTVVQADGKIVVAGWGRVGNDNFVVARYNTNGSLDLTFGSAGVSVVNFGGTSSDQAYGMVLQPDGKIVVAGSTNLNGPAQSIGLIRLGTNGVLDATFGGGDGIATTAVGTFGGEAHDIALQADGKFVITGLATFSSNEFITARFNSDGTPDATFGGNAGPGITRLQVGTGQADAHAVIVEPGGGIVAVGQARDSSSANDAATGFTLVRYTASGAPTAQAITQIGLGIDVANDIVRQADGKLLVAGYISDSNLGAGRDDFGLLRYNADFSLDLTFGGGTGKVRTDFGANGSQAESVIVQADGKILVAGFNSGASADFAIARYNSNGTPDTTFGGGTGRVVHNLWTTNAGTDIAYTLALQPDGKILVGGESQQPDPSVGSAADLALVRLNTDGSLDLTFGGLVKDGLAGNDQLVAGATGDWELNGRGGDDILQALGGNDTASGNEGNDTIFGEGGNDALFGNLGNDILGGGLGDDWMEGGDGIDYLYGGAGNDRVDGGAGNDVLYGEAGIDTMIGGLGDDIFVSDSQFEGIFENAGEGNDVIFTSVTAAIRANVETLSLNGTTAAIDAYGDAAANTLIGNNATNFMYGFGGNDWIEANGGVDWLAGGDGIDRLDGGAGNDIFEGGLGADILIGGAGSDTFRYNSAAESNIANGFDYIYGFEHGLDKIVAVRQTAADTFSFTASGADTVFWLDYGGNGSQDLAIVLVGVNNASAADVILG